MIHPIKVYKRTYNKQPNITEIEKKCVAYNHNPDEIVYFNHFITGGNHIFVCSGCDKKTPIHIAEEII